MSRAATLPDEQVASRIATVMRAVAIERFGGPDVLVLRELPVPKPEPHEVLIKLHSAGVGEWDAWQRQGGDRPVRAHFPMVLGTDGAGTVAACGARVRRFNEGDAVYAYDYEQRGFYAEYVTVAASHAAHVPKTLDLGRAGGAACIGLTALQGVDDALRVGSRDHVAVLGASGAVGHLALQFATLRGARVLAIASGDDGVALARGLGADVAVDGKKEDASAAARTFAPQGFDAVLALIGGDSLEHCLAAVRAGGRLAYPNGIEPLPPKRPGIDFVGYDGVAGPREFARLDRAVEAARLNVHIGAVFPLAEVRRAHERIAAGHVLGKIVLRV